jgi:hypothetical protein
MDRARCELACGKKLEEDAKKAAEAKRQAEKAVHKTKVDEAFALAYKLRDEYVKNYGPYAYIHNDPVTNTHDIDNLPTLGEVLDLLGTAFM